MVIVKIDRTLVSRTPKKSLGGFTGSRVIDVENCALLDNIKPPPTDMEKARVGYESAYTLAFTVRSKANTLALQESFNSLMGLHFQWIEEIEKTPGMTTEILKSLGYPLTSSERHTATVPPQANKPNYRLMLNRGEIELMAEVYTQGSKVVIPNWQVSEDKGQTWAVLPSLKPSFRRIVSGLQYVKEYWFQVAYATGAGQGPWSEPLKLALSPDAPVSIEKPKKKG